MTLKCWNEIKESIAEFFSLKSLYIYQCKIQHKGYENKESMSGSDFPHFNHEK